MKVKICGVTTPEDLALVDAAGADFAGFVLWPRSKRYVGLDRLDELAHVPVRLLRVGVFMDATPAEVARAVRIGKLDIVQLYGCPFRPAGIPVWRATPGPAAEAIVFDAAPGQGIVGDWGRAARLARRRRLVLAGGLTPAAKTRTKYTISFERQNNDPHRTIWRTIRPRNPYAHPRRDRCRLPRGPRRPGLSSRIPGAPARLCWS